MITIQGTVRLHINIKTFEKHAKLSLPSALTWLKHAIPRASKCSIEDETKT
jgi:hypothetical protein